MKRQLLTKLLTTKGLAVFMILAVVASGMNIGGKLQAQSIGDLKSETEKLQDDIKQNEAAAEKKHREAGSLTEAIGSLDAEISNTTQQINNTSAKISQLNGELQQKEEELKEAKQLLRLNMRALYKRGDASTVELIVGSDSFSEFMDEQEYLERVKVGIQDAANKVIKIKKQIKSKRAEQKEQLAKQEAAKQSLNDTRAQRANLLEKTRGQESEYRKTVKELEEKREQVEEALTAKILAQQFASQGSVGGGGGGSVIGRVGMTGFTFGPHLHFEIRNANFQPVNPYNYNFNWPVPSSRYVSQGYGCVSASWYYTKCGGGGSLHAGLDIAAPVGSAVVAAKAGDIIHRGDDGDGYGNKIVIRHNDGTYSLYAHLSY
jgi:septal ring factor EnvC (AmiA/AmiB activator)